MNTSQREPVTTSKVRFTLMGFDQNAGIRLYAFQGTLDGTRATFTVSVDLALIPTFGIQIQDLPLLCRELLERQVEGQESRTLTLTDTEMRVQADNCAMAREAAALRRTPTR
jgi:hypothetical protein